MTTDPRVHSTAIFLDTMAQLIARGGITPTQAQDMVNHIYARGMEDERYLMQKVLKEIANGS